MSLLGDNPDWRSAPAQNILPCPVMIIHFTRGSEDRWVNAEQSSVVMRSVKALWLEGR